MHEDLGRMGSFPYRIAKVHDEHQSEARLIAPKELHYALRVWSGVKLAYASTTRRPTNLLLGHTRFQVDGCGKISRAHLALSLRECDHNDGAL